MQAAESRIRAMEHRCEDLEESTKRQINDVKEVTLDKIKDVEVVVETRAPKEFVETIGRQTYQKAEKFALSMVAKQRER